MTKLIPRNLFMIWLGDHIPDYVLFSIRVYKQANPSFDIKLVQYNMKSIEDVYNGKSDNIYDKLLNEAIFDILNKNRKYEHLLNKTYMYILQHQVTVYGKDIRFILLLSDIYRLKLVQELGGIYVDCDTFPLKPFDDQLLLLGSFTVKRHYNNSASDNTGDDNYFLGSVPGADMLNSTRLLLTNDKWWSSILYLVNKKKFYELSLKYIAYLDLSNYILHYFDGNWKNKNGRIRTQKCFLDELYIKS